MFSSRLEGQSLLEVAIFGSIILMLLGILITYGLRYNSQQKTMQQSFRKSLVWAVNQPGTPVSNVVLKDVHIPNPLDTFGMGSITPFTGSASVVIRDSKLGETADVKNELPRINFYINGQKFNYLTAGFRYENNVPDESLARYDEIYGSSNVCSDPTKGCGASEGECLDEEPSTDPNTGEPTTTCLKSTKNIKIIDSCAGEIVDYGSAVKQCRMIVDSAACVTECTRNHYGDSTGTDCSAVCNETMNVPWYCANYEETNTTSHTYIFPILYDSRSNPPTGLFASSTLKMMGLQQNYEQRATADNALRKTEDNSGITTRDNVNYKTTTTRAIIYNNVLDEQGVSRGVADIEELPVKATTQIVTCEKNSTDCPYGYKVVNCSGEDCGQRAAEEKWPETKW